MGYGELIQLYFERSNALQWYWTLYVVVIGGLLIISSLRIRRDVLTCVLITVLFSCFAYKNLGAIHDVTVQRLAVVETIDQYPLTTTAGPDADGTKQVRGKLESTLVAPAYEGVRNFHVVCDLLTIVVFWGMELRRFRNAGHEAAK